MKRHKINKNTDNISICNHGDNKCEDSFDLVNRYGTYNIQPTADTDNEFPAIAQGKKK